jgi:AsmA family protein
MRKNLFLKLAVLVAAVVILLAVGLRVALKYQNLDNIKELLTAQVQTATGRTLTIAGPFELHPGLVPRLVAGGVTLSNPSGSTRPDMVKIKNLELEVALLPLLHHKIHVQRLIVSSPDVLIETEAKGAGNLDFNMSAGKGVPKPVTAESSPAYRLSLVEVKIDNGMVTWYDRGTKHSESVEIQELSVKPDRTSGELLAVRLEAKVRGRMVEIAGTVGDLEAAMRGKPWPLNLKAGIEGLALSVNGTIAELSAFRGIDLKLSTQGKELGDAIRLAGPAKHETVPALGPFTLSARLSDAGGSLTLADVDAVVGRRETLLFNAKGNVKDLRGAAGCDLAITIESDNLAGLSQLAGAVLPAKGPVMISGLLRGSGKSWNLSGIKAILIGSDLAGDLAVDIADHPHLSGKLSANMLNLNDFSTKTTPPGAKPASAPSKPRGGDGRVFPDQPLPVRNIRLVDADLALQVGKLVIDEYQLSDLTLNARLNNGLLSLKPFRFGLAGGNVEGEADLEAADKDFTASLRLTARQVELGRLNHGGTISGGKSDLKIDLKGRGHSVRSLMASLTGEMVLSVGQGKLQNKAVNWAAGDLMYQVLGAMNPLAKHEDTSQLTCAVARFNVRDGIATTQKGIAVRTDKVDVVGSGIVDLRTESLDLGIRPRARQGVGLSISSPLAGMTRLRGTFSNPSIGIDEGGTLRTAATVGAPAATGGLSLLGELLVDKATADEDPCRTALGQPQIRQQKGQAQKQSGGNLFQNLLGR